jgi:hypothetical protein
MVGTHCEPLTAAKDADSKTAYQTADRFNIMVWSLSFILRKRRRDQFCDVSEISIDGSASLPVA